MRRTESQLLEYITMGFTLHWNVLELMEDKRQGGVELSTCSTYTSQSALVLSNIKKWDLKTVTLFDFRISIMPPKILKKVNHWCEIQEGFLMFCWLRDLQNAEQSGRRSDRHLSHRPLLSPYSASLAVAEHCLDFALYTPV